MSLPCPACMPKHKADMAQPEEWRDENGVRAEGWLHDSRDYDGLLHCETCGAYFQRLTCCSPLRQVPAAELPDHRIVRSLFSGAASQASGATETHQQQRRRMTCRK